MNVNICVIFITIILIMIKIIVRLPQLLVFILKREIWKLECSRTLYCDIKTSLYS